ncbi:hypothetical protein BBB56_11610 [Candidatus Pantoea deserta]|uniref:Uncharacterized protein n=1 Tax=Candidatus Pantoea deserta TaxID=1869313 RepID=A0A3N4P8R6_9GAMM|nr:hypothetical protein BBB56_11610 [Pantoea deserta]
MLTRSARVHASCAAKQASLRLLAVAGILPDERLAVESEAISFQILMSLVEKRRAQELSLF